MKLYRTHNWSRAEVLTLAMKSCHICYGCGFQKGLWRRTNLDLPCYCVLRTVFDRCLEKYIECSSEIECSPAHYSLISANSLHRSYGFKKQEYIADFLAISKRTLREVDYKVFKLYFIENRQYRSILRVLPILTKEKLFNSIYSIQQKLGQAFRSTEPYPIYPVDEYFSETPCKHIVDRHAPTPPNKPF